MGANQIEEIDLVKLANLRSVFQEEISAEIGRLRAALPWKMREDAGESTVNRIEKMARMNTFDTDDDFKAVFITIKNTSQIILNDADKLLIKKLIIMERAHIMLSSPKMPSTAQTIRAQNTWLEKNRESILDSTSQAIKSLEKHLDVLQYSRSSKLVESIKQISNILFGALYFKRHFYDGTDKKTGKTYSTKTNQIYRDMVHDIKPHLPEPNNEEKETIRKNKI